MQARFQALDAERAPAEIFQDKDGFAFPFLIFAGGLSGAIMGFLFAGHVVLALGVFVAGVAGLYLGWFARGLTA